MVDWIKRIMMACVIGHTLLCLYIGFYVYTHIPASLTIGDIQGGILLAGIAIWFSSALLIISTFSYVAKSIEYRALKKKVGVK